MPYNVTDKELNWSWKNDAQQGIYGKLYLFSFSFVVRQRRWRICSHVLHHLSRVRAAGLPCVWHSSAWLQHLRGRHVSIRLGCQEFYSNPLECGRGHTHNWKHNSSSTCKHTYRRAQTWTRKKSASVVQTLQRIANKALNGSSNSHFLCFGDALSSLASH